MVNSKVVDIHAECWNCRYRRGKGCMYLLSIRGKEDKIPERCVVRDNKPLKCPRKY